MNPTRLQELINRRDEIASHAAKLAATPISERPTKPAELRAWQRDLEGLQALAKQFDALVERASPKPRVAVPDLVAATDPETGEGVTVARVRKGRWAEIRVTVKPWRGRRVVDVRVWFQREGQGEEMRPSGKGIAFDSAKLGDIIDALIQAKQHV